ncbi:BspA family leucine-rich repeat surface protein [Saccharicrinis sp. FJH2]|uniref:BspA family leucine-rich repeat surface protein n=1 Tax=Saccharicrinis sp. FJH65 TaxID=3344659 RepID=UPI0035F25884
MKKIFAFLLVVSFPSFLLAQMTLSVNTTTYGYNSVGFNLEPEDSIRVDWGDGNVDTVKNSDIARHSYIASGEYNIGVTGRMNKLSMRDSLCFQVDSVLSFGDLGLTTLSHAFENDSNLVFVPDAIPETVKDLSYMFAGDTAFNQNISTWKVDSITLMKGMFAGAENFNQDLSSWNISRVTDMTDIFNGCKLSTDNYTVMLVTWSELSLQNGVVFNAGNSMFDSKGDTARQTIIDNYAWTIIDGGLEDMDSDGFSDNYDNCPETNNPDQADIDGDGKGDVCDDSDEDGIIDAEDNCPYTYNPKQIDMDNDGIGDVCDDDLSSLLMLHINTIDRFNGFTFILGLTDSVIIDWGDGILDTVVREDLKTHTYSVDGIYTIKVTGVMDTLNFNIRALSPLDSVSSFGNLGLKSLNHTFYAAFNLLSVPDNLPESVEDLSYTFLNAYNFNGDISSWNVENVTNMEGMFKNANNFNQDIRNWDVSRVRNMSYMFNGAENFNQQIGQWDVSNVEDMSYMFSAIGSFNQKLEAWDVSHVTNMERMFYKARNFNSNISGWDVGSVTNMAWMFMGAVSFNQDIASWNVGNVTNMELMFERADSFNQDLSIWDVSSVKNMSQMFRRAPLFNQNIGLWNVSNVTDMSSMFQETTSFDQDLGSWNVSNVKDMTDMFKSIALSTENYNSLLTGWSNLQLQQNVILNAGESRFSGSEARDARQNIIDNFNWTIYDGNFGENDTDGDGVDDSYDNCLGYYNPGQADIDCDWIGDDCDDDLSAMMIFRINTELGSLDSIGFDMEMGDSVWVDWGDQAVEIFINRDAYHTYVTDGEYTIRMSLSLNALTLSQNLKEVLIGIDNFGQLGVTSFSNALKGATNLSEIPHDIPESVSITSAMFSDLSTVSFDISDWDVSNVTDMSNMFAGSRLNTEKYSKLLINWSSQDLQDDVVFDAGYSTYTKEAESSRQYIIDHFNWTIFDGGLETGTNINTEINDNGISIFPNPVNERFTIELTNKDIHSFDVQIFDVMGHCIYQSTVNGNRTEIKMNKYDSGELFYVRVESTQNNLFFNMKILKK